MEKPFKEPDPIDSLQKEEGPSAEDLDFIIHKAKPIDTFDTAWHGINSAGAPRNETESELRDRLRNLFTDGILGFNNSSNEEYKEEDKRSAERWKSEMKQKLNNPIYFNIMRKGHGRLSTKRIDDSNGGSGIQILFDINSFSEKANHDDALASMPYREKGQREFPVHSYTGGHGLQGVYHKDNPKKEKWLHGSDIKDLDPLKKQGYYTGYMPEYLLYSRVAPRFFTGIRLSAGEEKKLEEVVSTMLEVYKDKPEMIVPVYNHKGDMLYPKKMKYKEIVEMGKEEGARDASIKE